MSLRIAVTVLIAGVASSGCESGQTGSPKCAVPLSCACATLAGSVPVLAEIVSADARAITLRIDQLLYPDDSQGFQIADLVHGIVRSQDECGGQSGPEMAPGKTVFGAIDGTVPVCPGVPACDAGAACLDGGAGSCERSCEDDSRCTAEREQVLEGPFRVAVASPIDPLDFGDGDLVPLSELPSLKDWSTCNSKYPPASNPPCNDVTHSTSVGCAVSGAGQSRGASGLLGVLGMVVVALGARRARR